MEVQHTGNIFARLSRNAFARAKLAIRNRFTWNILRSWVIGLAIGAGPLVVAQEVRLLDGPWSIVPDSDEIGMKEEWWKSNLFPQQRAKAIAVPGNTYQTLPNYNGVAWYQRLFELSEVPAAGRRAFVRFGAIQYRCEAWLNSQVIGQHEGGEGPFEFEVTGKLAKGPNTLTVRVENPVGIFNDGPLPIFYNQGGIVGHVSLVEQSQMRIAGVYAKPNPATGEINIEVTCDNGGATTQVALSAMVKERSSLREMDRTVVKVDVPSGVSDQHLSLKVPSPHLWDLDNPFLYSVEVVATANGGNDVNRIERIGFRDFRIVNGYFQLNGRRIFLKCVHNNHYDPVLEQGVAGEMTWLGGDAARLKAAGFNAFRSSLAAPLPEQLDIADETGLLIYSEHAGSWLLRDSTKFMLEIPNLLRRDRNHPSLVIYGLLNEIDSRSPGVFEVARDALPTIRTIDNDCLILLSSGRWDRDFAYGSASNPGSTKWDVFLGGEGSKSTPTATLPDLPQDDPKIPAGGYIDGAGDIHVYNSYPSSWSFINAFRTMAASTKPVFVSEAGYGSALDPYTERLRLIQAKASPTAAAWKWVNPLIENLEKTWKDYGLYNAYPEIPEMIADSQREAAHERDLFFRALRSNPQINGFSLTSMTDWFGQAEGIWDNFRGWKFGHEKVITDGWAGTRFCLLVNPTPIETGKPFHLVAALADDDRLAAGPYSATLEVLDNAGVPCWQKICRFNLAEPGKRPLAVVLFDGDIPSLLLSEGSATIRAKLDGRTDLPGDKLQVPVLDVGKNPRIEGTVEAVGIDAIAYSLFSRSGATVKEFDPTKGMDHEIIICGADLPMVWNAKKWRTIYERVAQGAHLLIIGPSVLKGPTGPIHFLPLEKRGKFEAKLDPGVYPREVVAKPSVVFDGLPCRLLTGEIYGGLLRKVGQISDSTPPEEAIAVAFNASGMGPLNPGLVIATWKLGAGKVTVCTMDLLGRPGSPVADRLLINLVRYAAADANALQPLPSNFDSELSRLGILE